MSTIDTLAGIYNVIALAAHGDGGMHESWDNCGWECVIHFKRSDRQSIWALERCIAEIPEVFPWSYEIRMGEDPAFYS